MEAAELEERQEEARQQQAEREALLSKEDYINAFLDRIEGETLGIAASPICVYYVDT